MLEQGSWDRTEKIGQPGQENHGKRVLTGQTGQTDKTGHWNRTTGAEQPRHDGLDKSAWQVTLDKTKRTRLAGRDDV